jgi:hypothetical protein
MAVAPITQPLAPGISAVDYSPWSQAAQARSATPGILNYVPNANPLAAPTASPVFTGGTQYGNYVRNYPDLMAAFQNPNQTGSQNIQDWGKAHWLTHGQHNPSRILPPKPTDSPISLGDTMDTGGARVSVGTSGLPMPDVEGYKYEYPIYSWGGTEDPSYSYVGSNATDIDEYPYYPYQPTGEPVRHRNNRVLIGVRLVPK